MDPEDLPAYLAGFTRENVLREIREKVAQEKKVPASLLNGDSEEACKAQADAILAFARPGGYPSLRDGGEAAKAGGASTRDLFADWAAQQI